MVAAANSARRSAGRVREQQQKRIACIGPLSARLLGGDVERRRRNLGVPLQVNTPTGRAAFNPSLRVDDAHALMVTYYDFRDLPAGDTTTLPTDFRRKISLDGGATERRVGGRSI